MLGAALVVQAGRRCVGGERAATDSRWGRAGSSRWLRIRLCFNANAWTRSWHRGGARGFSQVTIDNDIGLLERTLSALGRPAWEVTAEDIDRVVGDLAVAGRAASTRREYVQIFKGFHRFLQVRKAAEIEASFGVRLVCPVDEFNASRHVGDDSSALLPPPTPERVVEFFEFMKARIATARKYAPAARDYAIFRTLYHGGLRSEEPHCWRFPMSISAADRSASCMCGSARALTRPARGRGGCRCWMVWTWCCAGFSPMSVRSSRTRRCCSPTSPAARCIVGRSATGCGI